MLLFQQNSNKKTHPFLVVIDSFGNHQPLNKQNDDELIIFLYSRLMHKVRENKKIQKQTLYKYTNII